jgi:hypothetical protein
MMPAVPGMEKIKARETICNALAFERMGPS